MAYFGRAMRDDVARVQVSMKMAMKFRTPDPVESGETDLRLHEIPFSYSLYRKMWDGAALLDKWPSDGAGGVT